MREKLDLVKNFEQRPGYLFISTGLVVDCSMMTMLAKIAPATQFGVAKVRPWICRQLGGCMRSNQPHIAARDSEAVLAKMSSLTTVTLIVPYCNQVQTVLATGPKPFILPIQKLSSVH